MVFHYFSFLCIPGAFVRRPESKTSTHLSKSREPILICQIMNNLNSQDSNKNALFLLITNCSYRRKSFRLQAMGILKELDVLKTTTFEMANSLKNISDLLTNKNAVIKLEVSGNIRIQTGKILRYHL